MALWFRNKVIQRESIMRFKKMKNLFLRQSYLDSWEDYERSLRKRNFIKWDYIILTASNEAQADAYREQISERLEKGLLPESTHYAVLPDPDGKRVGSGGATFQVMKYIGEQLPGEEHPFKGRRILVIHSGGDSKRVPQYSAVGKLFSPVPRELPDGRGSTLFDEFIIGMSGVPSRIQEGMLVLSGDVLLLFNPLQIDAQFDGAAAISIKEPVSTGKNHGVFLNDGNDYVKCFLHKQTEEHLQEMGAVNVEGNVDLDTGAVIFGSRLLEALYGLITTDHRPDEAKFRRFCNEEARISFYGDFLYPLASDSTLDDFYKEAAEGSLNDALHNCRTEIWNAIHEFSMKLICLSPAEFIHFGTTRELRQLVTQDVQDYEFLDWKMQVNSAVTGEGFAAHNAYVGRRAKVEAGAYLENAYVIGNSEVGAGAILSHVRVCDRSVPEDIVLHGTELRDGRHVVRIYGVQDNPKGRYPGETAFLGNTLEEMMDRNGVNPEDLWDDDETYLWFARLYPVCSTHEEALDAADILYRMACGTASEAEIKAWRESERMSLYSSFNETDISAAHAWEGELENRILTRRFIWALEDGQYYRDALEIFGKRGISEDIFHLLLKDAEEADFSLRIRIYYALSRYMKHEGKVFEDQHYDALETSCFGTIQEAVYNSAKKNLPDSSGYKICRDRVDVELPVRVNWGGGWTDTPPHCNEKGGVVLNAAMKLRGICPVQITVKRLDELHVEFESKDIGVYTVTDNADEIQDCHNPYDSFALHKAALIACGIIPIQEKADLKEILQKLGGGIYLSTQVYGVPKGSGLGTSSILSGACVKGIFEFLGLDRTEDEIYDVVLGMEQIMSTGGGWQDQVGGLTDGIKFITTRPGIDQHLKVEKIEMPEDGKQELKDRFALIYTGQRRLARNLLRDVVGGYIGSRPESLEALKEMKGVAVLMRLALEQGDIDEFASLLNRHWELSCQLDSGTTNTCIDQILLVCEELIDGKFISGAGGGGFIQVILKKGVTREQLHEHLRRVFQDSGVDVWDCELMI